MNIISERVRPDLSWFLLSIFSLLLAFGVAMWGLYSAYVTIPPKIPWYHVGAIVVIMAVKTYFRHKAKG